MTALVNGIPDAGLDPYDRGLAYGDGVFRTLRIRAGYILNWQRQYNKLKADSLALGITCPSEETLRDDLQILQQADADCIAKIIITRGAGRGYAPPQSVQTNRIVLANALPTHPQEYLIAGVRMILCETRLASQPRLAGIKHLNRVENVLARAEWRDPQIAEGRMLDINGNVIEGTHTNVFMLLGGVLYTPALRHCGVAGVERERILELSNELNLKLEVQNLPLHYFIQADEIFLCNSLIGVWQVSSFLSQTWEQGKLTSVVRQLLDERTIET